MSFIRLDLSTPSIASTTVAIFCPYDAETSADGERFHSEILPPGGFPVLYLNHGGTNNWSQWPFNSAFYRIAKRKGLFVVMPTVEDQLSGRPWRGDYVRFIAEDLPAYLRFLFPVSEKREDTFIAGLSYGGYFSYRIALKFPEKYYAAGAFSSPLDVKEDLRKLHPGEKGYPDYNEIDGTDRDLFDMAKKLKAEGKEPPRLYQACGTEDFTWKFNTAARETFTALGLDLTWEQGPGSHDFDFWQLYISKFIDWLPLKDRFIEKLPFGDIKF
jgi:S-formylglutathione hydrolase FrmB